MKTKDKVLRIVLLTAAILQVMATAITAFVATHILLLGGYFNDNAGPLHDDPIVPMLLIIALGILTIMLLSVYLVRMWRSRQEISKVVVVFAIAALAAGLCMVLYLYLGPLGACMAIIDECGG